MCDDPTVILERCLLYHARQRQQPPPPTLDRGVRARHWVSSTVAVSFESKRGQDASARSAVACWLPHGLRCEKIPKVIDRYPNIAFLVENFELRSR